MLFMQQLYASSIQQRYVALDAIIDESRSFQHIYQAIATILCILSKNCLNSSLGHILIPI